MASQSSNPSSPSHRGERGGPNKAARATFAKHTINTIIPHILQNNTRARLGNESTERIYYSPTSLKIKSANYSRPGGRGEGSRSGGGAKIEGGEGSSSNPNSKGKITGFFKPIAKEKKKSEEDPAPQVYNAGGKTILFGGSKISDADLDDKVKDETPEKQDKEDSTPQSPPKVSVVQSDTLNAAQVFINPADKNRRVAVLNMASFLRPGGGVVTGAIAQEESLCLRSTLYTSLDERFYRLPKFGGLFTKDILVFRDSNNQDLPKSDWYFVDVISVAALKNPDLIETDDGKEVYEFEQDKEEMISKIKLILLTALQKKTTHLILGALGCGAYYNPPEEVAKMFKRVIFGDRRGRGAMDLSGIEEIVFAIFDDGVNLRVFREVLEGAKTGNRVVKKAVGDESNSGGKGKDVEMGGVD